MRKTQLARSSLLFCRGRGATHSLGGLPKFRELGLSPNQSALLRPGGQERLSASLLKRAT